MEAFRFVEAEDIEKIDTFFSLRDNWTCDSTFMDSFLWRGFYDIRYRIEDNAAVQWLMHEEEEDAIEVSTAVPLCSAENLQYYFEQQQRYFNEVLGLKMKIYLADENALEHLHLDPEKYHVEEAVDYADYLYDAKALRELPGKKYHKKKNHINAFLREYEGRFEYRTLTCADSEEILAFLKEWDEEKGEEVHLEAEAAGVADVLENCFALKAKMGGVYVDGKLQAFSIGTYNARMKMSIVHIEKANPEIRGLYPYINQQFQVHEFPEAEVVNREDDMGLPGLRKAKESYHPIRMARKFNIEQL